jgi:hypothetical protein
VGVLTDYRTELQADGFDEQTICQQAMAMIGELEEVICNEDIEVNDKRVAAMIKAEYGSESWAIETFLLLKCAGYTKAEALAWVIMDDPELTNEELLKERTLRFYIKKVYDDI